LRPGTKFFIREKPNYAVEVIDKYVSSSERILSDDEKYILYRNLGSIYALKYTTERARRHIEEILAHRKNADIRQFILGLYEETLKQYPIPKH